MPEKTTDPSGLCLTGDWSISGVTEQFHLLTQYFALLSNPQSPAELPTYPAQGCPEMDLAEITALDACGCQLLAHFSRSLQQQGLSPRLRNIPAAFLTKIRLLGFGRALNLSL